MEGYEILYLSMVIFTCYGFNLAQGLRAAINRGDTVRITPKILCSIYCISVSIIASTIASNTHNTFSIGNDLVSKTRLNNVFK